MPTDQPATPFQAINRAHLYVLLIPAVTITTLSAISLASYATWPQVNGNDVVVSTAFLVFGLVMLIVWAALFVVNETNIRLDALQAHLAKKDGS